MAVVKGRVRAWSGVGGEKRERGDTGREPEWWMTRDDNLEGGPGRAGIAGWKDRCHEAGQGKKGSGKAWVRRGV